MSLWLLFALMTAAAMLAVLWPLTRRGGEPGGSEIEVYRDQLDEIARDRLPVKLIGFTGGEPFMNPGIIEMLDCVLSRGLDALVLGQR